MGSNPIRERILGEHDVLRGLLAEVETLARRATQGESDIVSALRRQGIALHDRLAAHLALEDRLLVPVVRASGRGGEARAERIETEHLEQRLLLEYILSRLRDEGRPTLVLGRELLGLVECLLDDMAHEESSVLDRLGDELASPAP